MTDFDVAVIGAGVVGLACAARLSSAGRSVLVIERNQRWGEETSSRNSGVIHAGVYYQSGSLKATLCVRGRRLLYQRCKQRGIPHHRCGKLIVATSPDELATLETIQLKAAQNDVALELLSKTQVSVLEPHVKAVGALFSPETGIVDAHELMYSYQKEASDHDCTLVFRSAVDGVERTRGGWLLSVTCMGDVSTVTARQVVNAAGLHAGHVAELAGLDLDATGQRLHWCKGDYFALAPRLWNMFRHLIYPVPVHAGLGVHLTFDLAGKVTAGPDTEYVNELSYKVDETKAEQFAAAVGRYFPGITSADLSPDYAGIRPKLQGAGESFRDFVIAECSELGLPGWINLAGIESPGLTASEAIAERVLEMATP